MIVSSVFALKEATTIPDNLVNIPSTKLEEGYYYNSSLNFLLECHEELLSYRRDYYKAILESSEDDPYVITESFSDFVNNVKAIIKKIIAYIETLVKRFVTQIAKFVGSDKYIIKMKKELDKFTDDDKFTITGYNYTITDGVPVVHLLGLDLTEFEKELRTIDSDDVNLKINKLSAIIADLSDPNKMDNIRGQILNLNTPITETSFANELFAIFRDGSSDEHSITIKKADVLRASRDYEGYKAKIKSVKALQADINSKYKHLESQIDNIVRASFKVDGENKIQVNLDNGYSTDYKNTLMNTLNNLINTEVNQIQRIANLHVQAFAAKLDALNAITAQDKNILYTALQKVQKNINNTRTMRESLDLTIEPYSHDYTRDVVYKQYQLQKHFMNENQRLFVRECIALSESNISELKSINEDLTMDKKEKFEKFRKIMKNIINKFTEKMGSFANRDKKYLEEHKDTILTKTVEKPYTINNMPTYSLGIKNINSWQQPNYNIKDLVSLSKEDIQKKVINTYDGNGEFSEFAKRYFLCNNTDNKDILSTNDEVDMKKLYEYCINMPNDIKRINTDSAKFESSIKAAVAATLNASTNESVNVLGRKYIYSSVLEMYINEEDVNDTKSAGGENQKETEIKPAENQTSKQQTAKTDNKVPEEDKEKKETDKNDNNQETKEKQSTENKKAEETASWYIQSVQVAIAAKITAMQKIYSEYMKIIRYHVGVIEGKSEDKPEDDGKLKSLLKEFKNAKSSDDRKAASNKIIDYFKTSKGKTIDAHEVQSMADSVKDN